MKKLVEILGWYGTGAIILAYILVSFSLLQPMSIWYQILNGTGALGIVIEAFRKKDYQPVVLNVIWTLVAVIAIFRLFF
jgi:hypothetical protein